jgi:mono/diheme cytochrome c family protein
MAVATYSKVANTVGVSVNNNPSVSDPWNTAPAWMQYVPVPSARYYASQRPARQPIEGATARMAAGKALFEGGVPAKNIPACVTCHGSEGQGNGMFPRIAGQI